MPRRTNSRNTRTPQPAFRFEYVNLTDKQITELKKWMSGTETNAVNMLQGLAENGWKVSFSQHEQTSRFLVSLTDKWDRKGMKGLTLGIDHSQLLSAICAAYFYATEYLDNGLSTDNTQTQEDAW